jgi:exopolysaccharide production protein ExoQ
MVRAYDGDKLGNALSPRRNSVCQRSYSRSEIIPALVPISLTIAVGTGLLPSLFGSPTDANQFSNTPAVRAAMLACYSVAGALVALRYRSLVGMLLLAPELGALLLFPSITLLWSVSPGETLDRFITLIGSSAIGIFIGWRFALRNLLLVFAMLSAVIGVIDIATILLAPSIGLMGTTEWEGAWRGLQTHKNTLGIMSGLGATLSIMGMSVARGPLRVILALAIPIEILLVINSHSVTGQFVLALAMLPLLGAALKHAPHVLVLLTPIVLSGFFLTLIVATQSGLNNLFEIVGRSGSLSDRLPLWLELVPALQSRPWLGYGYAAFWGPSVPEANRVAAALQFEPFYSHNGILELVLHGGLTLLGLFIITFGCALARSISQARLEQPESSFPLIFIVGFTIANVTEAFILARNSVMWIQFVAIALALARFSGQQKGASIRTPGGVI